MLLGKCMCMSKVFETMTPLYFETFQCELLIHVHSWNVTPPKEKWAFTYSQSSPTFPKKENDRIY